MRVATGIDEATVDRFRYGACYPMAFVLHAKLGWPIEGIIADRGLGDHMVHAYAVSPDGRPFDAGGFVEREEMMDHYFANYPRLRPMARLEQFADGEAFLQRLHQLHGAYGWGDYLEHFREMVAAAEHAYDDHIAPHAQPAPGSPGPTAP